MATFPVRIQPPITYAPDTPFDFKRWVGAISEHADAQDGWKNECMEINIHGTGATDPAWSQIGATNFYAWNFANGGSQPKKSWATLIVPHDYKFDTNIYLNAVWCPNTTGAGNVAWNFSYTYADGNNQAALGFASPTTVQVVTAAPAVQYKVMISELSTTQALNGTTLGIEPGGIISLYLYRDSADVADTYAEDVFGLAVGMHYQTDGRVTMQKAPSWTKFGKLGI